jgi:hypothetical protein
MILAESVQHLPTKGRFCRTGSDMTRDCHGIGEHVRVTYDVEIPVTSVTTVTDITIIHTERNSDSVYPKRTTKLDLFKSIRFTSNYWMYLQVNIAIGVSSLKVTVILIQHLNAPCLTRSHFPAITERHTGAQGAKMSAAAMHDSA